MLGSKRGGKPVLTAVKCVPALYHGGSVDIGRSTELALNFSKHDSHGIKGFARFGRVLELGSPDLTGNLQRAC